MVERIALSVSGMHCDHCVESVTQALKGLDGVKLAKVSLADNRAQVTYDNEKVTLEDMVSAIKSAGYEAERLQE
ncbi:MAG: heavy-metal-associated domain-containing protein [Firmicutes bacterium]|nr:heavy-metal-associated domain-containing protein [Bacillota bacterium]